MKRDVHSTVYNRLKVANPVPQEMFPGRGAGPEFAEILAQAQGDVSHNWDSRVIGTRPRTGLRWALGSALAATIGAAVLLSLVFFGTSQTFVGSALAAVGDGPVLHALIRRSEPSDSSLVRLSSGKESAVPDLTEVEVWYSPSERRQHTVTRVNGVMVGDVLETPGGAFSESGPIWTCERIAAHPAEAAQARVSCDPADLGLAQPQSAARPAATIDPALGAFLDHYRSALLTGRAKTIAAGVVAGRRVVWLEFRVDADKKTALSSATRQVEQVAVDSSTHLPLRIRFLRGGTVTSQDQVVRIGTRTVSASNFSEPKLIPRHRRITRGDVIHSQPINIAETQQVFGSPIGWAGESVADLPLRLVERQVVRTAYQPSAGLRPRLRSAVTLIYGGVVNGHPSGAFIEINQTIQPEAAFGWVFSAVPPRGFARVNGASWAYLRFKNLYIRISGSSRVAVIQAARQIRFAPARN